MTHDKAPVPGLEGLSSELERFAKAKKVLHEVRSTKSTTVSFRLAEETKAKSKELAGHYGLNQTEVIVILIQAAHRAAFGEGGPVREVTES